MRIAFAIALAGIVVAGDAYACTCLPVDLERDLPGADGAFVGTVLERREPPPAAIQSSAAPVTLVFRVEQVYKGEIENRIEVVTARESVSCGVATGVGQRTGLLLERKGGVWRSSLCSQVEPAAFLELTDVDDNSLPAINWGGYVIGTLVLAAGAFFLVRRLRRYRALR
jgi:hypothetical protein